MAKQIPADRLVIGRYYVGRDRNGNVGLWDGKVFLVLGEKFGKMVVKREGYFSRETGCFQPFREIDEGQTVEPMSTSGWDAHYARVLAFGGEAPSIALEPIQPNPLPPT